MFEDPIGKARSMEGWKSVPIEPKSEPLVLLNNLPADLVTVYPGYFACGIINASVEQYARENVARRLLFAAADIQTVYPGHRLRIFDAYRPFNVQQSLFDSFFKKLASEHPDWDAETLSGETQRYVSLPSINPFKPSPHITGGAVDLTVVDRDGTALNMGTEWDAFDERSRTDYFETEDADPAIQKNRRLLVNAMRRAGFTNYPEEWWHFDYGNQFWGHLKGKPALYLSKQF